MSRLTSTRFSAFLLLGLAALPLATPAVAQSESDEKGFYATARIGGTINPDQKLDAPGSTFEDKVKYKSGVTGEIGGGYDFGMFRLEQTIGYTTTSLNTSKTDVGGFIGDGRSKMFSLVVSGFVDIPVSKVIVPYVGVGAGIARVDAQLSRVDSVTGIGSSYAGKDYGILLHGDAGVGIHVAPKTVVEIGGRYTRVNSLSFSGQTDGTATRFKPEISTISGTLGVRYTF